MTWAPCGRGPLAALFCYKAQFAEDDCVFVAQQCCIEVLNGKHLLQFAKKDNHKPAKKLKIFFRLRRFPHIVLLKNWGPSGGGKVF